MYTLLVADFVSRRKQAVCISPVSTSQCLHILIALLSQCVCRQVFVVVAFPPPPVTFPATRLTARKLSKRLRILLAVPFQKMLSVFIQITQKGHLTFPSKPFGFDSRCYDNLNSASSIVLKQCVTALPAYPCIGQKPVSSFDCRSNLTPRIFFVKQKILQVLPLFYGLFFASCGKLFAAPVENSVENF